MAQEVISIPIDSLKLWTENPRDPIDITASDYDVIDRATRDASGNWNLEHMIKDIGRTYYYNELPTVVPNGDGTYIVYDGNRRVVVFKCLAHPNLYSRLTKRIALFSTVDYRPTDYNSLPCNVCDRDTALDIVERTHRGSKKWGRLQYEQFLHIHRNQPKGPLMLFDEISGGLVGSNQALNEEYVEKSLLTKNNLNAVGLDIDDGEMRTSLDDTQLKETVSDIAEVANKKLSTYRKHPRDLLGALRELDQNRYANPSAYDSDSSRQITFSHSKQLPWLPSSNSSDSTDASRSVNEVRAKRKKPVQSSIPKKLFNGMTLRPRGKRSNEIYRAIDYIYDQYRKDPGKRQFLLPVLGFSMRLLLEVIAREYYEAEMGNASENCLNTFIKEKVKPLLKSNDRRFLNMVAIDPAWIDGSEFESIISKYAHGSEDVQPATLNNCSKIIALVVNEIWSDDAQGTLKL